MCEVVSTRQIRSCLCLCTIASIVLFAGCSQKPLASSQWEITRLFDGFVYVGERAPDSGQEHSTRSASLPPAFVPNHEYIFHHSLPSNTVDFATDIFPARLHGLGFAITSAPDRTGRGVLLPSDGEPIWMLKASRGTCILEINHEPDKRLATNALPWEKNHWEYSDYVLKVTGSECGLK